MILIQVATALAIGLYVVLSKDARCKPLLRESSCVADNLNRAETTQHPGEQRPVIHRELRIIRRISRERPQDRAHNSTIDNDFLFLWSTHEHPLFQTHCLCSRPIDERSCHGRPRISLRAAGSAEHVSDCFREGSRYASVAQLVLRLLRRPGFFGPPHGPRSRCDILSQFSYTCETNEENKRIQANATEAQIRNAWRNAR